jgi:hypothetical protein
LGLEVYLKFMIFEHDRLINTGNLEEMSAILRRKLTLVAVELSNLIEPTCIILSHGTAISYSQRTPITESTDKLPHIYTPKSQ